MALLTNINGKFTLSDAGAVTFNDAFTFPTADGSANYVLQTNGSGQIAWAENGNGDITGSGTAGTVTRFTGSGSGVKTIGDGPITFSGTGSVDSTFAGFIQLANTENLQFIGSTGDHARIFYTQGDGTTGDVWSHGFYQNSGLQASIEFYSSTEAAANGNIKFKTGATANTLILDASQNATFVGVIHTSKNGGAVAAISTPRIRLRTDGVIDWGATYNAGQLTWDSNYAFVNGLSGKGLKFGTNGSTLALTLDTSQNATFVGDVTAPTFLGDLNGTINTATTAVTQINSVDNTTVATTAYVVNKIAELPAGLNFLGTWNASTNAPALASGGGERSTGTSTTKTENKLIDSAATFTTAPAVVVGDRVRVVTPAGPEFALVTAVDSDTQLTLAADIVTATGEAYILEVAPFLPEGGYYIVGTNGATDLNGITDWKVGDWVVASSTNVWQKIDNSSVLSGSGTGGSFAGWAGSGTSVTLGNAPVTFSGNNSTFAGAINVGGDIVMNEAGGNASITLSGGAANNETYQVAQGVTGISNGGFSIRNIAEAKDAIVIQDVTCNVGIGTSAPSDYYADKLVVKLDSSENGITIVSNSTTDANYLMFADGTSGSDRFRGQIKYNHQDNYMEFATNASNAMIITSSGNVGIGTGGFAQKRLDISGATGGQVLITSADDAVGSSAGILLRAEGGEANGLARVKGAIFFERIAGSFGNGKLKFAVNTNVNNNAVTVADTAMTIDDNRNVGIGITSTSEGDYGSVAPRLHVLEEGLSSGTFPLVARFQAGNDANDTGAAILINHNNDRGLLIEGGRSGAGTIPDDSAVSYLGLINSAGSLTRMITLQQSNSVVTNSYNVGIGTATPNAKLEVYANSANLSEEILKVKGGGSSGSFGFLVEANNGDDLFKVDTLSYNSYFTNGKVGIGTTDPGNKLTVATSQGGAFSDAFLGLKATATTDTTGRTAISLATSTVNNYGVTLNGIRFGVDGTPRFGIKMHNNSGGGVEAFSIKASGSVGIGTITPDALLHVKAVDGVTGTIEVQGGINPVTAINQINSELNFGSNDSSATGGLGGSIKSVTEFSNGAYVGMSFYTCKQGRSPSLAEAMRINFDGNVGIGQDTPLYALDVYRATGDSCIRIQAETASASTILRFRNQNSDADITVDQTTSNQSRMVFTTDNSSGYVPVLSLEANRDTLMYGDVGIGNTSPDAKLEVTGTTLLKTSTGVGDVYLGNIISASAAGNGLRMHSNNSIGVFDFKGPGENILWRQYEQNNNGNINSKFGMKMDTGAFTASGDVVAFGSPSDKRLKENIKPIESALDKISKLQGVTFDWKKSDSILDIKQDIGFIAQDVQKVIPELVRENENGMLSMRHQGITPILLEAIKELKAEIEELKSKSCNCK